MIPAPPRARPRVPRPQLAPRLTTQTSPALPPRHKRFRPVPESRDLAGYGLRGDPQRYFAQVLFAWLGWLARRRGEIPPVRRKLPNGTMGGLARVRARLGTWRGLHGYA